MLESQVLSKTPVETCPEAVGEVRLLQAVKVPAGHQKLVHGRIDRDIDEELLLFTPHSLEGGVLLPDSVIATEGDKFVTLVVQNHGHTAVRLVKGLRLGMVTPVHLVPDVDKCGADSEGSTCGETEDGEVRQLEQATSSS